MHTISQERYSIWSWFLVHLCKMMISPGAFFFFHFFKILIFRAVRRVKGQKWPKMKNNYTPHASYLRNSIAYDHEFWHTVVKWWYLQVFFSFFWNFDFWGCLGVKGQKMAQNEKLLYPSGTISQDQYGIVHDFWHAIVKWYLHALLSFFQNFDFWGC